MEIFKSCFTKQKEVENLFQSLRTPEERYHKIMELGRALAPFPSEFKQPENIVKGCQSILYLHTTFQEGLLFFAVASEALISLGLASLLVRVYNGESPEVVLKCPPAFIETLGLSTSLTPGRSNGLASMHLRMKQEALKALLSIK